MVLQPLFKRIVPAVALVLLAMAPICVQAGALLVIEADTGKVLQAENATQPWYPASVTKLMTTYVTLKAVKEGRLTLDTVLTVSPAAAAQAPSKMGFRSGIQVTVDNALKMMMVKSANDMAVVLAEGVGGSVDGFSAEMNKTAQRLGMTQTSYVNPNGLPAEGQITSARDLGILARAIIRDLPEYEYFVHIPAIRFGRRVTPNFNKLIGRFPGADGMKTGFICASGFNLVASATRNNKRLIAVVLGAPSSRARAVHAAQALEKGFSNTTLTWLRPSLGTVENLAPIEAAPPNLRDEMCGPKRKRPASETEDENVVAGNGTTAGEQSLSFFTAAIAAPALKPSEMLAMPAAAAEPVIVYTGPKKTGTELIAAVAVETANQTPKAKGKGKRTRVAAKPATSEDATKTEASAKPEAAQAKPKTAKRKTLVVDTNAAAPKTSAKKPDSKPAAADAKPAKPRTAAKPKPKPGTSSEVKPTADKPAAPKG